MLDVFSSFTAFGIEIYFSSVPMKIDNNHRHTELK